MNHNLVKYKRLELFLNKIDFKKIKVGSLLTQVFELSYYNGCKPSIFRNLLILLKYSFTLPFSKPKTGNKSTFIFTKLGNRFHLNELIDPLVLHYLDRSLIVWDKNSFDQKLLSVNPIYQHSIDTALTISNSTKDSGKILLITLKVLIVLLSKKQRLKIRFRELLHLVTNILIQLRKVSYWDTYFNISVLKPKCIVTEYDRMALSSPLILSAKKNKIHTVTLTHGVINGYGFVPVLADHIFCWGESQKKQLINLGVPPHRISVTGNPMIKNFTKYTYKRLNSFDSVAVCLAISPEEDAVNLLLIESFADAVKQSKDVTGIVKLHPSLKKANYLWLTTLSTNIKIFESTEITNEELFKVTDLLIVHFSGIANEALAAGTPVVVMEPAGLSNLDYFQKELTQNAGCKVAVNSVDLIKIFNEYKTNPELFRLKSIQKSEHYLKDMYEITGEESIRAMINEINRISG